VRFSPAIHGLRHFWEGLLKLLAKPWCVCSKDSTKDFVTCTKFDIYYRS